MTPPLLERLSKHILVLDGATATMLAPHARHEGDFRGARFVGHSGNLLGNYDLLSLTKPKVVSALHDAYLAAGADIISTNTFSGTSVAQAGFGLQTVADEINLAAAHLARSAAHEWSQRTPQKPRFVAGVMGPTAARLSLINDERERSRRFDDLRAAFAAQVHALMAGGVDLLLAETVMDLQSLAACRSAINHVFAQTGRCLPVMVSVTITKTGGRTLCGQTLETLGTTLAADPPFAVGINCAYGAEASQAPLRQLADLAPTSFISCHPNAGLPNKAGHYEQTPEMMQAQLAGFASAGLVNILGGCCGTTPQHIAALSDAVKALRPRQRR